MEVRQVTWILLIQSASFDELTNNRLDIVASSLRKQLSLGLFLQELLDRLLRVDSFELLIVSQDVAGNSGSHLVLNGLLPSGTNGRAIPFWLLCCFLGLLSGNLRSHTGLGSV